MFKTYLPIKWSGHLPINDFGIITLLDVEFCCDFGPWKKLEIVPVLVVDFCEGWMEERNACGGIIRRCKFIAIPDRRNNDNV